MYFRLSVYINILENIDNCFIDNSYKPMKWLKSKYDVISISVKLAEVPVYRRTLALIAALSIKD